MSWYDGTKTINFEEFINNKTKIANNLYFNEDKKILYFINDLTKESPLYSLADPKMEVEDPNQVFYNFIFDSNQSDAKEFITEFDKLANTDDTPNVSLYRKDKDSFYWYSYGRIVTHLLNDQESLKSTLPDTVNKDNILIIPLNKYYYKCPVCFYRTLQARDDFNICSECGWEDEGIDLGANGHYKPTKELLEKYPSIYKYYVDAYKYKHNISYEVKITPDLDNLDEEIYLIMTPEVYREDYLKLKEKEPNYSWVKDVGLKPNDDEL